MRVWLEELPDGDWPGAWRGQVEHVMTGEYRSIETLTQLCDFVLIYLRAMGVADQYGERA
ncbi:MAG: hypothetical protein ACXV8R_03255 [Acidimicrobiia bacterium]